MSGEIAVWNPSECNLIDMASTKPVTSLQLNTRNALALLASAMQGADMKGQEHIGKQVDLVHWLCYPDRIVEERSGELVDVVRTVLFVAPGRTVGFVSASVVESINQLTKVYGSAPWEPPLKVTIAESKTRKGNRWYRLLPVTEEAAGENGGHNGQ